MISLHCPAAALYKGFVSGRRHLCLRRPAGLWRRSPIDNLAPRLPPNAIGSHVDLRHLASLSSNGTLPDILGKPAPGSTVALVDASSFVHRYYHVFHNSKTNSQKLTSPTNGEDMSVVHSFLSFVLQLLRERDRSWRPVHGVVVVFDMTGAVPALADLHTDAGDEPSKARPGFRRGLLPDYKENRSKTAQGIAQSVQQSMRLLDSMGINTAFISGWEADDIIATLACTIAGLGQHCTVFSRDKDFLQLLQPGVDVVQNESRRAAAAEKPQVQTVDTFQEAFGFVPSLFPDYQALTGDSSDNVKGVPSWGAKRAAAVIQDWGSLENVFTYADLLPKSKAKANLLEAGLAQAVLTRSVVRLNTSVRTEQGGEVLSLLRHRLSPTLTPASDLADAFFEEHALQAVQAAFRERLAV